MFGGPDSDVLMEVSVPVWSKNDCQSSYIERISDAVVCAGDKNGGRDSCQVFSTCIWILEIQFMLISLLFTFLSFIG